MFEIVWNAAFRTGLRIDNTNDACAGERKVRATRSISKGKKMLVSSHSLYGRSVGSFCGGFDHLKEEATIIVDFCMCTNKTDHNASLSSQHLETEGDR